MGFRNKANIVVVSLLVSGCATADVFFAKTPLRPAYQALAENNIHLAYQELTLALQQGSLKGNEKQWTSLGSAILSKSECGRTFTNAAPDMPLKISLIARGNPTQSVYQVEVTSLGSNKSLTLDFRDSNNVQWFSGTLSASDKESIFESPEWLSPLPAGAYTLKVNKSQSFPVFVVPMARNWLDTWSQKGKIILQLPRTISGCPPVAVYQEWFDDDYEKLGKRIYINAEIDEELPFPSDWPQNSEWLSTVVARYYFQGGLQIELQQRVTLPVSWLKKYKKDTGMTKQM